VNVTDWPKIDGFSDDVTLDEVDACPTVWVIAAEELALKLLSPAYDTAIVCIPTARAEVVKVALPPESAPAPMETPLSVNVTVPVAVPPPGLTALTVAVKVTDWPNTDGLADERTLVMLSDCVTVCVIAADALALKLLSPP
jgi:hypothetical protein